MQKAITVEEYYTPCFYYLGYIQGKGGKMDEAAIMYSRAMEINPMDMNIFIYQRIIYVITSYSIHYTKLYEEYLKN